MNKRTKLIAISIGALAALGIGTGVVLASSGDDDKPLQGSSAEQATQAALDHVGGGTVLETEAGDDGAAYGVEIEKDDGSVVEVSLDAQFNVVGTEQDDDGAGDEEDGPNDD